MSAPSVEVPFYKLMASLKAVLRVISALETTKTM